MTGARQAVAFLTPLGGASAPSPAALRWFPAVGAAMGAGLGGLWWAAVQVWPPTVAAAVVVVADLVLSGMLHVDGLADTADGLVPHLDRDRRLSVMAEPQVGAYATVTVVTVLLLRWAALSALAPAPLLLAGLWCASRTAMALTAQLLPYARPQGLAQAFLGRRAVAVTGLGGVAAAALLVAWDPLPGLVALLAAGAGASAVAAAARRRLGGFTGDVLGACGVAAETLGLVAAGARW